MSEDPDLVVKDAGGGKVPPPAVVDLSSREQKFSVGFEDLKEFVATEVLKLFRWSLFVTLGFATVMVVVDAIFIYNQIIKWFALCRLLHRDSLDYILCQCRC